MHCKSSSLFTSLDLAQCRTPRLWKRCAHWSPLRNLLYTICVELQTFLLLSLCTEHLIVDDNWHFLSFQRFSLKTYTITLGIYFDKRTLVGWAQLWPLKMNVLKKRRRGRKKDKKLYVPYRQAGFFVLLTRLPLAAEYQGRQASSSAWSCFWKNLCNVLFNFLIERGHAKLSLCNLGELFSIILGMHFWRKLCYVPGNPLMFQIPCLIL